MLRLGGKSIDARKHVVKVALIMEMPARLRPAFDEPCADLAERFAFGCSASCLRTSDKGV